ncbi:hypothetical protein [Desulfobacter sp. UBA2225]|uniref:hypothetical protein n=1 Tax=Desulfobacter sp. UBA2225 TaxID=1961413 RepID=UPI00257EAD74|nr:hypothetical protein [Desulfobacter sp. UBA2225]
MNRSKILALLMLVSSAFLLSGCMVPADGYHSDPYYSSSVVVVPALPYTVNLYERPYYSHHGYYYFYNNQRWYYSRTRGGNWIALPRTHWPRDTRWKGRHYHNDHRDHKYDQHDRRPPKDPKHRPQENPRWNDKNKHKNDSLHRDPRYNEKNQPKRYPHNKDPRREDPRRLQKDKRPKEGRHDQIDPQKHHPGKRAMDPRQHDRNKMKQEQNEHNQRKRHPLQNNRNPQDGKNPTGEEEEINPDAPQFKRR